MGRRVDESYVGCGPVVLDPTSVIVIGPVGLERHFLVEPPTGEPRTGHAVARTILAEKILVGGSGYFASYSLERAGIPHTLLTNFGGPEETLGSAPIRSTAMRSVVDDASGFSSAYLSIWAGDTKELFVQSATDPSPATILAHLKGVGQTVIALSLGQPGTYSWLADIAERNDQDLYIAPNQTLVGQPEVLSQVMLTAKAIFLNYLEARATLDADSFSGMVDRLRSLQATASVIVTHSGKELSFLSTSSGHILVDLPYRPSPRFVLGGGDMFAALAATTWNDSMPVEHLRDASTRSSELIHEAAPF
jgi:hypothetical protein